MNYTISREIGRGSFGTVFLARDQWGARFAAKVADPCDPVACELLTGQFEFLSALNHSRIVRPLDLDLGAARGPTMITEFVDGVDLRTFVERSGRDGLPALAVAVLDALRHIHAQGKVHGDLKPDGILVWEDQGRPEVTLVDAGFDFSRAARLPTIGGTLPYLAPEIIRNSPGDARSDLYSLGVVLYEVLTGVSPFEGSTEEEILRRHLEHAPAPASRACAGVDPAWDRILARLLEKEPMLRYSGAAEAALHVGELLGDRKVLEILRPARELPESSPAGLPARAGELAAAARDRGVPLLVGGTDSLGIARCLRRAAVAARVRGEAVWTVPLQAGLPAVAQILETVEQALPDYLAGRSPGDPGPDGGVAYAAVVEAFEALRAGDTRTLLVVERGEAMDAAELDLLSRACRRFAGSVGVVIGRLAAGGGEGPGPGADFERVDVPALSEDGVRSVLLAGLGVASLPDGLAERAWQATGGDRRMLEGVVGHLWKSGGLRYSQRGASLEIAWDSSVALPAGLAEAIAGQIGRLSSRAREVLALICLAGGKLASSALTEHFRPDEPEPAIREILAAGLAAETDAGRALGLTSDEVRSSVLGGLPWGRARDLCLKLGPILEARLATPGDYYALGLVYRCAGDSARALDLLEQAGAWYSAFSPGDALRAYGKALDLDPAPDRRAEIGERMGDVRLARGDIAGALSDYEAASSSRLSALRKLGWATGLDGRAERALAILEDCRQRAGLTGQSAEGARVLSDLGYIHAMASRYGEAVRLLEEARHYYEGAGMDFESGIASNRLGIAEARAGNHKRAFGAWQEALSRFERAGARRHVGMCLVTLARSHHLQMDFDRAGDLYGQALAIFEESRSLVEKARCCHNYGLMMLDLGDLACARSLARDALDLHTLLGQRASVASTRLLLAAIELEAGNVGAVKAHLEPEAGRERPEAYERSIAARYLAWAEALRGDREAALGLVEESFRLASSAGDADGQSQALLKKSEVLLRFGLPQEALELAVRARTAFGLAGSTLLATVAERIVGEALLALGREGEAADRLESARAALEPIALSLHMARVLRALAEARSREAPAGADALFRVSADICRQREARYDYALTLLAAGRAASRRGRLIRARRCLVEAGRVSQTLGAKDLERQVNEEMERALPGETEITAVASLSRISQVLNSSHDLATVLDLAMDLAMEYLGAERGVLMLEMGTSGEPATVVHRKMDKESVEEVLSISKSIVESVRSTREPVIASDAKIDPRFRNSKSVLVHNVMSVMCVPLMRAGDLVGLIYLDNRDVPSDFSRLERAFVEAFANQVVLAVENARSVGKLLEDVVDLKARAGERYRFANIIGPGKAMQEVFRQVEQVAGANITVMITGDSGTGKELIAGLLHDLSARRDKPMITVNCGAIHKELLEAELFGIEKDVATGVAARPGFFERADGGTIFLDEIGDMELKTQTKVLRVLAERELERVGGSRAIKVDVRVISATNQNLQEMIRQGAFRQDLYFRLNAMRIHVPALRERMGDLPALVDHFVRKYVAENSKQPVVVSRAAYEVLRKHTWPGNVRELENCVEHAVVLADGPEILPQHLAQDILNSVQGQAGALPPPAPGESLPVALRRIEREWIVRGLREALWVQTVAAGILGIHESTLRKKMKAYGITRDAG